MLRDDAKQIITACIDDAMPGNAVRQTLSEITFPKGKLVVVSAGKAAWEMASAAAGVLQSRICSGIVITKYHHSKGTIPSMEIYEAGHPVPDENGVAATKRALELTSSLTADDSVLFLLSGGGSALFESPLVPLSELEDVTGQLLACGADIVEMNTIRKRLSEVKGGRFAMHCAPAHVFTVVLSDVVGDRLDMIASGPSCPDTSTCQQAEEICRRYQLHLTPLAQSLIHQETPKELDNVTSYVTGSVRSLCRTGEDVCRQLGYTPIFLTSSLSCEAREAGSFLAAIARDHQQSSCSLAFIAGGETVVHLTGKGKGGRNQEIALAAAAGIEGCKDTCIFSFGSDGTDGPTDAAGGMANGETAEILRQKGWSIADTMADNNAYNALAAADSLIITGPTGTNVNDLSVLLIKR